MEKDKQMKIIEEIDIEERYKDIPFMAERKINVKDIKELVEWIQSIPTGIRQKRVSELAYILDSRIYVTRCP